MANGERRDIERRLHDGVQQDLVALAVNLQLADEAVGSDQAALKKLLAEMRHDVRDAIEAVRGLARDVYPPLLTDLGLAEALRSAASAVGTPVRVEAEQGRYPADIEATVYFSCLEALENMALKESARRATVRLWREDASLLFEIAVEGGPAAFDEVVLDRVRIAVDDRVGAVDGSVSVVAESGRARFRATIPLSTDPRTGRG